MKQLHRDIALRLFDDGALQTKEQSPGGLGFRLKHHIRYQNAPLSPFQFNIRTKDNPKRGPLGQEMMDQLGKLLFELATSLNLEYDYIAGVPNAGNPLAEAFAKAAREAGKSVIVLFLRKSNHEEARHVDALLTPAPIGARVLVIDDLITKARSKAEAVKVLTDAVLTVVGVVVLIDRQQDGIDELLRSTHVQCYAVFKLMELLDVYYEEGRVTEDTHREIYQYLQRGM